MRPFGTKIERLYFNQFSVRGGDWFLQGDETYKRQGPAQFPALSDEQILQFPEGYFDIQDSRWMITPRLERFWPGETYAEFMAASIVRRTFAPMLPPVEVHTRDGFIMEPGLEVMFVGGKVSRRHGWNTEALLGRRMIAWCREEAWYFGPQGKLVFYGNKYIKVRERSPHAKPRCWWVVPFPEDGDFIISGRGFDTTHQCLAIEDPEVSLITIDGRRLVAAVPALPAKEPFLQA